MPGAPAVCGGVGAEGWIGVSPRQPRLVGRTPAGGAHAHLCGAAVEIPAVDEGRSAGYLSQVPMKSRRRWRGSMHRRARGPSIASSSALKIFGREFPWRRRHSPRCPRADDLDGPASGRLPDRFRSRRQRPEGLGADRRRGRFPKRSLGTRIFKKTRPTISRVCTTRCAGWRRIPRVDAIGGSAAGVYVNNEVRAASLFRGVPATAFWSTFGGCFSRCRSGGVPFEVVNDGELTALAGSMSMNDNAVLGVSMSTRSAGRYVTPAGNITAWLNELAFD